MRPVCLIGFMGAGKTTVAHLVAKRLDRRFCDLDREIESAESRSVDQLFELRGEAGFRAIERATLQRLLSHDDAILACGGGVVTDEGSRALLREGADVVYLAVSPEEALRRIGADTTGRPLLRGAESDAAAALMTSRERFYDAAADCTVLTVGRTADEVADRVCAWVRGRS